MSLLAIHFICSVQFSLQRVRHNWATFTFTFQFSSVVQLCLILCHPMDCSKTGFPVHHQLPELAQTHVHRVSNAIQPSHPLSPCSPALNLSQHQSLPVSQFFTSGDQSIGVSVSTSVLPMNIQEWFPLGLTGWISLQSKGLSRVFYSTTVQKHQFFGAQFSLWSLTSIHDYWQNHSFNYMDFCWQSDVSAF